MKLSRVLFTFAAVLAMLALTVGGGVLAQEGSAISKNLSTNFTLVNMGSATANVNIDYIADNWDYSQTLRINPNGGQAILRQYGDPNLAEGQGSVVIASDQPLGALVQIVNRSGTPTSGAYSGVSAGDTTWYIPLVGKNADSATGVANSQIVIQALQASSEIQVAFTRLGSASPVHTEVIENLGEGASFYLNVPDIQAQALTDGFYSAVVTADVPVAVVSNLFFGPDGLMSFNAFPQSETGSSWFIPLLYSRLENTLTTSIALQNMSGEVIPAGDITMSCSGIAEPFVAGQIPVNGSFTFNTLFDRGSDGEMLFPGPYFGACSIESATGKNFTTLVLHRYTNKPDQGAFGALPGTTTGTTMYIPLVAKVLPNGFATAITIQNLGDADAHLVMRYAGTVEGTGERIDVELDDVVIPAGRSLIHNFRLNETLQAEGIPAGFVGTLVVTSDQPIGSYIANTYLRGTGDQFMAYTGFTTEAPPQ